MAVVPGYKTLIKKGGSSTTFTSEAFGLVAGKTKTYKISDATKNIFDPAASFSFEDDGVAIDDADIVCIDFMYGRVTFTDAKTGPITGSGKYIPTSSYLGTNAYTMAMTAEILDTSYIDQRDGSNNLINNRQRISGLKEVTLQMTNILVTDFYFDDIELDPDSQELTLIEITPGGGSNRSFRGWFLPSSIQRQGGVGDLESAQFSLQIGNFSKARPKDLVNFAWSDILLSYQV